jgi:hypothetical protein
MAPENINVIANASDRWPLDISGFLEKHSVICVEVSRVMRAADCAWHASQTLPPQAASGG